MSYRKVLAGLDPEDRISINDRDEWVVTTVNNRTQEVSVYCEDWNNNNEFVIQVLPDGGIEVYEVTDDGENHLTSVETLHILGEA